MTADTFKKELDSMDTRLSVVEQKLSSVGQKLIDMDTKLSQIIDALIGNPITQQGGLIAEIESLKSRTKELEQQASKLDEFKKKFIWTIAVVVAGAGIIQFLLSLYISLKK